VLSIGETDSEPKGGADQGRAGVQPERLATEKALGRPVVSSTNFLDAPRRKRRKKLPSPDQSSPIEQAEPDQ
jgi:hypothetical protein